MAVLDYWTDTAPSTTVKPLLLRGGHTATVVGDRILVVAGRKGSRFWRDLLSYTPQTQTWAVLQDSLPLPARANHHAVLVEGRHLWVFGGADNATVFGDVWVLDTQTLQWTQPTLRGRKELLVRCSAGADLHPTQPHLILLFGGYGVPTQEGSPASAHFNDLVCINTRTGEVSRIHPQGTPPAPRCFHTFTTIGTQCWVVGGRIAEQGALTGSDVVAVYDATHNAWLPCHTHTDTTPPACDVSIAQHLGRGRSSHKATVVGNRLLITGGNIEDESAPLAAWLQPCLGTHSGDGGPHTDPSPDPCSVSLQWSLHDLPDKALANTDNKSRSAHGASLVGDVVYLTLGYTGGKRKAYLPDILCIRVPNQTHRGLQHQPALHSPHTMVTATETRTVARAVGVWDASTGTRCVQAFVTRVKRAAGTSSTAPQAVAAVGAPSSAAGVRAQQPRRPSDAAAAASPHPPHHTPPRAHKSPPRKQQQVSPNTAHTSNTTHSPRKTPQGPRVGEKRAVDHEPPVDLTTVDDSQEQHSGGGGGDGEGRGVQGVQGNGHTEREGAGWQRKRSRPDGGGGGGYAVMPLHTHKSKGHKGREGDDADKSDRRPHGAGPAADHQRSPHAQPGAAGPSHAAAHTHAHAAPHAGPPPQGLQAAPRSPYPYHTSPTHHVTYADQGQVMALQQRISDLHQEVSRLQQGELLARGRSEIDQQALDMCRASLAETRASLSHKTSELAKCEMELREAQKQANSAVLQQQTLANEKTHWLLERQRLMQEDTTNKKRCEELKSRVHTLEASLSDASTELKRVVGVWEQRVAAKDETLSEQSTRISALLASLEGLRTEHTRVTESHTRLERDLVQARDALSECQRVSAAQQQEAAAREVSLRNALEARSVELRNAQQRGEFLNVELTECKARNAELERELAASRQAASTAEATAQQLRLQLNELQSHAQQATNVIIGDVKKRQEDMQRLAADMQRSLDLFSASMAVHLPAHMGSTGH